MIQPVTVTVSPDGSIVIKGDGVTFQIAQDATPPPPPPPPPPDPDPETPPPSSDLGYIWVDPTKLHLKPRMGRGWDRMFTMASATMPGPVTVSDQTSNTSAWAQACAYVYATTGDTDYLAKVLSVMRALVSPSLPIGRALGLAREVQGYVAAAEGIQLATVDADLDAAVRNKFRYFLTCKTSSGPASLLESHQKRPNNWGTHATSAVMMIARYIGDATIFADAVRVFRGYLGDYDLYHAFVYGDLAWQADPKRPVGINPPNSIINGLNVDGMLPEEARRGSTSTSDYPGGDAQMYSWEATQGTTAAMAVALNAGVDLRPASSWAHKRSIHFMLNVALWPIKGDDAWQAPVLNMLYPDLALAVPDGTPGKGLAWTEFTHM